MSSSKQPPHQTTVTWTVQQTVIWQAAEPAPEEDVERHAERYREQMRRQGTDDAVFERDTSTPRNVDIEHAHRVADEDWETDPGRD